MQEWLSRGSPQRRARCHTADLRAAQAFLHPDAHQEGGLACTNKTLLEQQRLAILDLVRGRQLLWPARACVRGARRALGSAPIGARALACTCQPGLVWPQLESACSERRACRGARRSGPVTRARPPRRGSVSCRAAEAGCRSVTRRAGAHARAAQGLWQEPADGQPEPDQRLAAGEDVRAAVLPAEAGRCVAVHQLAAGAPQPRPGAGLPSAAGACQCERPGQRRHCFVPLAPAHSVHVRAVARLPPGLQQERRCPTPWCGCERSTERGLRRRQAAANTRDPVERLRCVATWCAACCTAAYASPLGRRPAQR